MPNIVPFAESKAPAHIVAFTADNSNIDPKLNVPQLSFRGKVWRTVIDGEEKPLMNGEDEPVSTVHVVVLDHNKARSRSYYEGAYEEGKSTPPSCWSTDGDTPDKSVKVPQSASCSNCPMAVKGSKITPQNKAVSACSVIKRIALVPLSDMADCPPLLLRIAQTSMWDKENKENEAKGYYAWDQYLDMLRNHGANHTAVVATKVRFDSRVAYPKLLFAASRWLVDEELDMVKPLLKDDRVQALLKAPEIAVAARADPKTPPPDEDEDAPAPVAKKKAAPPPEDMDDDAPPPPPKKKAAPPPEDEEAPPPPPKKKAAPPPEDEEAPPPPKKKAAPPPDDDDAPPPPKKKAAPPPDDDDAPPPPTAKKKPAAAAGANGLAGLVNEWTDAE